MDYMKHIVVLIIIVFTFTACGTKQIIKNEVLEQKENNVSKLYSKVISLSEDIDKHEAKKFSQEVIFFSKKLAFEYEVQTPALIHNTLINLGLKQRGLCYHYANDLLSFLKSKNFKTINFKKVIAKRGEYFEHTALILTRDDIKFENAIIFDAWRDSGELFFSSIKDDNRYIWELK